MKLKAIMMTTAVSAVMATGAFAQTSTTPEADPNAATTTEQAIAPTFMSIDEMTVGDLLGKSVYDPNGDSIGDIDYVLGNGFDQVHPPRLERRLEHIVDIGIRHRAPYAVGHRRP